MKELPTLHKHPDREYIIGVDITNEGNSEIFLFCVLYYLGNIVYIEQLSSVINKVDYIVDSPTEKYITQLAEYYNAPIYREF